MNLRAPPHRRFAGGERGSRVLHRFLKHRYVRVRATEHAPRDPFHVLDRRHGLTDTILVVQSNIAVNYGELGNMEKALSMKRDVYSGCLRLYGEEHEETLRAANNYTNSLFDLRRFKEGKTLLRKRIPLARRALGEGHRLTLKMRSTYARALFDDTNATLDDLREAVTTLEDMGRIARRVLGGAHPLTTSFEEDLRDARATLRASEDVESVREAVEAMTPPGGA